MNTVKISFVLNGERMSIEADPTAPLVDLLRGVLGMTGTKKGCGVGECGACTVIVDGDAVNSCLVMSGQIEGSEVITVEGLERAGELDELQQAFIDEGAIQCGYCTSGMLMSAKALLMKVDDPTDEEIKVALSGNICRCTGYKKIIAAVRRAAELRRLKA